MNSCHSSFCENYITGTIFKEKKKRNPVSDCSPEENTPRLRVPKLIIISSSCFTLFPRAHKAEKKKKICWKPEQQQPRRSRILQSESLFTTRAVEEQREELLQGASGLISTTPTWSCSQNVTYSKKDEPQSFRL